MLQESKTEQSQLTNQIRLLERELRTTKTAKVAFAGIQLPAIVAWIHIDSDAHQGLSLILTNHIKE